MRYLDHIKPWMVLTAAFLASLVLGVHGGMQTGKGLADACYLTLQLITLNAGLDDGPKPMGLEIARFALPAIASFAVLKGIMILAGRNVSSQKLRFLANRHYIICGLGDRGMSLAMDLLGKKKMVAVIVPNPDAPGRRT